MSLRAGIVVTGTEVVSGVIVDRNGPWVSERLGELGVEVSHILTVGDRPDDLREALEYLARSRVGLIVTTGGLGPTADDLTAEVVAAFAGRDLVLDEELEERIAAILRGFAKRMRFDPEALREANRKQAMVPEGAEVLEPVGTAPGLVVGHTGDGPTVVVLPGPPRELQGMWDAALATRAVGELMRGVEPFARQVLRLFGLPESEIAKTLTELAGSHPVDELEITTCLRRAELEIDIRARRGQEGLRDAVVAGIVERHGRLLFSSDGETIDELVATSLAGRSLALAESCTGGLLAARLSERPGSSEYLRGGVVAYSNQAKTDMLGVDPDLIAAQGAVSAPVALAMARGAIERFSAEIGVAITGVAGPGGGTDAKPVGYVCLCALDAQGGAIERDLRLPGSRADVRDRSVVVAMHMIRTLALGETPPL